MIGDVPAHAFVHATPRATARTSSTPPRFALLCGATANGGVAAARYVGGEIGFGPTAAALVDLVVLFIPLLALVVGTMSLARDRERESVAYLVALPMTLGDVVTARLAGVGVAMTIVVCARIRHGGRDLCRGRRRRSASGFLAFAGETCCWRW